MSAKFQRDDLLHDRIWTYQFLKVTSPICVIYETVLLTGWLL